MGTEDPASSSSSFTNTPVVPAPLSAAHFEPTHALRRASLSATAQLSLRSPNGAEPKSAPSTPVADHHGSKDQRQQQQPAVGHGPGYFALVLNTANSVANALNLKPASDAPTTSNANSGNSSGPNTAKYDMKKISDKRPATVTVSLDDVTGKTGGVGGDSEIDVDGNVTSSPKSADMLKLQLPEPQHASGTASNVAQIDAASTYFDTTDVTADRQTPINVMKKRPLVSKSHSAVELQNYNELETPMAKSYSSTTSLGDFEKARPVSSVRIPPQGENSETKFPTFPYKRDSPGTSVSPGHHTMPRPSQRQQKVDTSLQVTRNGLQQGNANADTPVTGSDSSANEYIPGSSLSGDISTSPSRSAPLQLSSSHSSTGGPSAEEAALSLSASLSGSAKRKNAEFHSRFKSVPADEVLIDEYKCALSREILVQGKLYVTEHHVCFYASLFGWVTQLVIAFQEIVNLEKKNVLVFPNAIQIETTHSKHFFASFLSRDVAFAMLMECWNSSHSNLMSSPLTYEPLPLTSPVSSESIESYTSNDGSGDTREIDSGEEQDSEEMASDTEESESSTADQESHKSNTSPTGNATQIHPLTIPSPCTASEVGTDKEVQNTPESAYQSDTSSEDNSFLPTSSSNATDSNSFKKKRSRHRGLLSRRAGSNGALSLLAASTLGSVVFDTAAAAAAASGKRRRAQTDINSRRREEAAEARRKVTAERLNGPKQSSKAEPRPAEPPLPEKQTAKSDPTPIPSTAPPPTAAASAVKHAPSTCLCAASAHGPERQLLLDKVYSAPPRRIFTLIFDGGLHATDDQFSKALMEAEGGYENVEIGKWRDVSKKGEAKAVRNLNYDRRQSNPIGPKLVHCNVVEDMMVDDPERCFTVHSTVVTPNVPSGNCFSVKLLTCLTWAENEQCRMQVNLWMEWTAKSWIKGMIESKVTEGNIRHYEILDAELQKYMSQHASEKYDAQPSADPSAQVAQVRRQSKKKSRGKNGDKSVDKKEGRTSTKRKSRKLSSAAIPSGWAFLSDPMGYIMSPANLTQIVLAVVFIVMFLSHTYVWVRLSHLSARIKEQEDMAVADSTGKIQADDVAWRATVRPSSTDRDRQHATQDFARDWAPTKEEMDTFWDWLGDVEGGYAHSARSKAGSAEKNTSNARHPITTSSPESPASKQKSHMHEMSKLALATERQLKRVLEYVENEMKGGGAEKEGRKPEPGEDVPGSDSAEMPEG